MLLSSKEIFNEFVLNYGFPKKLHHDRAKEFQNKLFQRLQELSNIIPSPTTPYHPQGNEHCERFNRLIVNMLKTLPENQKSNGEQHIKKPSFACNSTVNKATRFSPFCLLIGCHSILPIDYMYDVVDSKDKQVDSYPEFVKTWHATKTYNITLKHEAKNQFNEKTPYKRRVYSEDIKTGDRVLLKNVF